MLEHYFHKPNCDVQHEEVKREKAVAAVLEIIKTNTSHAPLHIAMKSIKNDIDQAADAIQAALDK